MPDVTPRLGLKKPLGNETVSRAAYNENLDILDDVVAKEEDLAAHLAEIVTTPQANKILRLDANAKLPASITGDAATVAGKSVGNGSGQVPVSNGTVCTNLNSDKVDSIHFRVSNGVLQYSTDGSVWNEVSVIANVLKTADFKQVSATAETWYTALNITGAGVLYRISAYATNADNSLVDVRVTVDGTVTTIDLTQSMTTRGVGGDKGLFRSDLVDIITHIKFDSALKIEVKHSSTSTQILYASIDYGLI